MVSPQPSESVCERFLLCGQLERAAEELLDCWSAPGLNVQTSPNLVATHRRRSASSHQHHWTRGGRPKSPTAHRWSSHILVDTPTFGRFIFNWLLEGSDVTEGAKKQDHLVLLVPDWSDLYEEPNRHPCVEEIGDLSHDQRNASWGMTFLSEVGWERWQRETLL